MVGGWVRAVVLALATPLLEKNPLKTVGLAQPVVFSMARVIVLGFAVAMVRRIWSGGIGGWPEAGLAIAVVLAIPILTALDRVRADDVRSLTTVLVERIGISAVRPTTQRGETSSGATYGGRGQQRGCSDQGCGVAL
jgi:hypothetical protein